MQYEVTGIYPDGRSLYRIMIDAVDDAHLVRVATAMGIKMADFGNAKTGAIVDPERKIKRNEFICPNPNCGFIGKPLRKSRGSCLMAIVLLSLFIVPGLIYCMMRSGYRYRCPRCGMQVAVDN